MDGSSKAGLESTSTWVGCFFFFEIPNEHCRHIQDTFYPPCNFPYNSTAVLKQLQYSHITKEAFRYGTTAK